MQCRIFFLLFDVISNIKHGHCYWTNAVLRSVCNSNEMEIASNLLEIKANTIKLNQLNIEFDFLAIPIFLHIVQACNTHIRNHLVGTVMLFV